MTFTLKNRTVEKIGVIGSGQIGPDIALHFTKVLEPHGVPVVVVDVSEQALAAGRTKVEKKIGKGVESKAFRPDQARRMQDNMIFTTDYGALSGANLVIEAATEDRAIKHKIVAQLETVLGEDAVIASNSSHMEPEAIFSEARNPGRGTVIHYFFPAERNIVVEIVPGKDTDPALAEWLLDFYEAIGKAPVKVRSRYGYAVDPVFEGLFQAAAMGVEAGWGSVKQVDSMCAKALGLGVGPFTAMNLTGGNPITAIGLQNYTEKINRWFHQPEILKKQLEIDKPWETARRGETVEYTDEQFTKVKDSMMGVFFGLCGEIVDARVASIADLEMAVEVALVVNAPFRWMNRIGVKRALELVRMYAAQHEGFVVPECIRKQADSGEPFEIPMVLRKDTDGVAVLKIRRPKVLNALNLDVLRQLRHHCEAAEMDDSIEGAVITGFGVKAFVSGADIDMLSKLRTAAEGERTSRQFHGTLDFIENMRKPVVCAYNGLALGGGNELAMSCHARIARKGMKILAGQPEVNLGIIPGAGGTQRLPRLVGLDHATRMMRTARPISGAEGREIGLLSEETEGDLVPRAVEIVKEIVGGKRELKRIQRGPMKEVPGSCGELDLGHLSRAIDKILCDLILAGARSDLASGLKLESKAFGKCVETKDMHIGMTNFLQNGPRARARFVHE